ALPSFHYELAFFANDSSSKMRMCLRNRIVPDKRASRDLATVANREQVLSTDEEICVSESPPCCFLADHTFDSSVLASPGKHSEFGRGTLWFDRGLLPHLVHQRPHRIPAITSNDINDAPFAKFGDCPGVGCIADALVAM